jgi:hypothetical protein
MTTQSHYDFSSLKPAMQHQDVNLYDFQPIMSVIAPDSIFTNRAIIEFKARIHSQFRDLPNGGFQKPVGLNSPDGSQVVLYPEPMLQRLAELIRTELAEDFPMV